MGVYLVSPDFRDGLPSRPRTTARRGSPGRSDLPRQTCAHCDYEITGLDLPGRLIRCPECGRENRIGHVDLDAAHEEMPEWWRLAIGLGWPAAPWAVFMLAAMGAGPGPLLTGMIVLGGLVLFVAIARATSIAFDCSVPGRRSEALSRTLLWAIAGSVGLMILTAGAVFSLWAIGMFIESVRPK
ncbi:MAG: hypothetical protein AB7K52_05865 [Phycisphaerales bacterium]